MPHDRKTEEIMQKNLRDYFSTDKKYSTESVLHLVYGIRDAVIGLARTGSINEVKILEEYFNGVENEIKRQGRI